MKGTTTDERPACWCALQGFSTFCFICFAILQAIESLLRQCAAFLIASDTDSKSSSSSSSSSASSSANAVNALLPSLRASLSYDPNFVGGEDGADADDGDTSMSTEDEFAGPGRASMAAELSLSCVCAEADGESFGGDDEEFKNEEEKPSGECLKLADVETKPCLRP